MDMNQQQVTAVLEARKAILRKAQERFGPVSVTGHLDMEVLLIRNVLWHLSQDMDLAAQKALDALKEESS